MARRSARLLDVRSALHHRPRLGPRMRAALVELGRVPVPSFREVARRHRVDLSDLHGLARSVPGLLEGRRAWQSAMAAGRRQAALK